MMAVVILNDFCDSSYSCLHTFTKVLPSTYTLAKNFAHSNSLTGMMEGVMSNILTVLFLGNAFVFQVDYLRGLITLESLVVLCLVI